MWAPTRSHAEARCCADLRQPSQRVRACVRIPSAAGVIVRAKRRRPGRRQRAVATAIQSDMSRWHFRGATRKFSATSTVHSARHALAIAFRLVSREPAGDLQR